MSEKKYVYSEVFHSIQGEGHYTGVGTAWLRFFLCNLQCDGFGQKFPTKPETYELPYKDFDAHSVNRVEDLPVWDKGCDSSYTWSKKFKHLMGQKTPTELAALIRETISSDTNPEGKFLHPNTYQKQHMCFTGGEPLMRTGQQCSMDILRTFIDEGDTPESVTYETNGTQRLSKEFKEFWEEGTNWHGHEIELFMSVSPKLWTVAGEKPEKAIKPEIVGEYAQLTKKGQLKFVVGPEEEQWEEMESVIKQFREAGVHWPVWVMPTGARLEEQEETAGEVAQKAFKRGYNVAARVHVYLFGNLIGT